MIYPKRKRVIKAASGLDADKIEAINGTILSGVSAIPGIGQAVSGALSLGKGLGEAISGDGTNGAKNAIGNALNPMSIVNSLASGKIAEAIPLVGGFIKAKRRSKEEETLERLEMSRKTEEMRRNSNAMFSKLTYGDGGVLPGDNDGSTDKAVILSGKDHEDGGNPIVDKETGEKVAETEREELIFSSSQTAEIEKHIAFYKETGDKEHFIHLGKIVSAIVNNDTVDYSKKLL